MTKTTGEVAEWASVRRPFQTQKKKTIGLPGSGCGSVRLLKKPIDKQVSRKGGFETHRLM